MAFNWTCPHCDRAQAVTDTNTRFHHHHIALSEMPEGSVGYSTRAIKCANPDCHHLTLVLTVHPDRIGSGSWERDRSKPAFMSESLIPRGRSKPQPEYIPQPIRDDYAESCLIRDLSPKSAATLARRALQGMIRDFAGISRRSLDEEIKALQTALDNGNAPRAVSVESVEAIDHVRRVGNIGAHMEHDINEIIDIDPGEAQALIELVELLMREWYVDRHLRQERLSRVAAVRADMDHAKLAYKEAKALPPPGEAA